jgi:hypothetical protein
MSNLTHSMSLQAKNGRVRSMFCAHHFLRLISMVRWRETAHPCILNVVYPREVKAPVRGDEGESERTL